MKLRYRFLLLLFVLGLLIGFLGWLVVRDPKMSYGLALTGFCISATSFLAILISLWEEPTKEEKEARALEDQLKELKEQLGTGVITQEEYEQKKKLLEKVVVHRPKPPIMYKRKGLTLYRITKCVECGREMPIASEECPYCKAKQEV